MEVVLGWLTRVPGLVLFLLIMGLVTGIPVALVDWWQKRRRQTVMCQVALTDAIYGRFGTIASPVVKSPLWGPWQIQLVVRPGAVGKALVATHEVFSMAERMQLGRYEVVLMPQQAPVRETQKSRENQVAVRWSGDTKAAA